jgi:hypothetical protein
MFEGKASSIRWMLTLETIRQAGIVDKPDRRIDPCTLTGRARLATLALKWPRLRDREASPDAPCGWRYRSVVTLIPPASVATLAAPEAPILVADLLP